MGRALEHKRAVVEGTGKDGAGRNSVKEDE